MKYKCCEYLLHQIVFDIFDVKPCCEASMNKESIKLIEKFDGIKFDINEYLDKKQILINEFKAGRIPAACTGCPIIKEKDWDNEGIYFDRIIVANTPKCSCNCIYCVYTHDNPNNKKKFNTLKAYDIKPILEFLRNQNLIKKDFMLIVGGGECSEFTPGELEWLIYFTSMMDGKIQILSSGIKYSDAIAKILKAGKAELIISPDSGTKKVFEKIKRVKAYNLVWNNIFKYIEAAKGQYSSTVKLKYIIIPTINDSINEAKSFIKKCKKANCTQIHIDIEHFWFKDNKNKEIPKNIKEIIRLFKLQKDINISYSDETKYWFEEV